MKNNEKRAITQEICFFKKKGKYSKFSPLLTVHRDLKPCNILVNKTDDGGFEVKISDFFRSKQLSGNDMSSSGVVQGTQMWRSPEMYKVDVEGKLSIRMVSKLRQYGVITKHQICRYIT